MADFEKAVRDRLLAHAGVSALVGTGNRVWYDELPEDPTLPAITVQELSAVPEGTMGDDTGHVFGRIQAGAWDTTRQGAKDLGEQIRDALQRYRGVHESSTLTFVEMNSSGVLREPPGGRSWVHFQDFEGWFTESVA